MNAKEAKKYIDECEKSAPDRGYFVCCIGEEDLVVRLSDESLEKLRKIMDAAGTAETVSCMADVLQGWFEESGAFSRLLCLELKEEGYELAPNYARMMEDETCELR